MNESNGDSFMETTRLSDYVYPELDKKLAITNTTWQRKKAAGADSSDLRPIWLRR